jgi:hypothetical protein
MAAQTEIVDQLKAWIKTGVSPFGAQVRRMDGRCETPLSSWKKIHAFRRRAFFLPAATFDRPIASLSPDCALWLAWLAAAMSSPSILVSSTHVPGDSERRSDVRQLPPRGGVSIDRCQTHGPLLPFVVQPRHVAVVPVPTSVCDPLAPRLAVHHYHPAPTARTSDLRSGDLPAILGQSSPGSSCQRQISGPHASVVVPLPQNPDVVESEFACIHFSINRTNCHSIMRGSVRANWKRHITKPIKPFKI